MKTNDIHLCAYPKSGVTYLSFLLAAARLRYNNMAMTPTFFNIDYLVIDTHKMQGRALGDVWRDGSGNFLKTHSPYLPVPNAIFLLRNPFDTLKSYYFFRKRLGSADTPEGFLAGPEGISGWLHHLKSWINDNKLVSQSLYLVEYERLTAGPAGELRCLLQQLGFEVPEDTIDFAVEAAKIENMRRLEKEFAARNPVYRRFNLEFVREGSSRQIAEFGENLRPFIEGRTGAAYEFARRGIG
jgi:hypothetical protein